MPIKDPEAQRQYMREYREKNREKLNEQKTEKNRKHRAENPLPPRPPKQERTKEQHAAEMREWRKTHREEYNAKHKAWADANREKLKAYDREWRQKNLEHARAKDRERYANNPKRREYRLAHAKETYRKNPGAMRKYVLRKYGLSSEQFDAMLIAQQGRCEICENPFEGKRDPAIDHCHANDQVRGLLCENCNIGLGHFKDSPKLLERAASYLRGKE